MPLTEYVTMLESIFKIKLCLIKYKRRREVENLDANRLKQLMSDFL